MSGTALAATRYGIATFKPPFFQCTLVADVVEVPAVNFLTAQTFEPGAIRSVGAVHNQYHHWICGPLAVE